MDVHAEFYKPYLAQVPTDNILESLEENKMACFKLFNDMDEERSKYRYAEGKWSLRELLGHMIDAERVFSYRAMCFARGESQALPGFDENEYAEHSNAHERSIASLLEEFETLRSSTIQLFKSFDDEMLDYIGMMSGHRTSVRSIGKIIVGHCRHHLTIISERY